MDKKELDNLNKIASQQKKKTFRYKQFTIRSTYGISQSPCCGNNCMYCLYGCIKTSTDVLVKNSTIYDW
jgi:hypothetical protein